MLTARAPATVSNVGPGFDAFGFALDAPADRVTARVVDRPGVVVTDIAGDGGRLPRDTHRNTASVAAARVWAHHADLAARCGLDLSIAKGLPLGSGLGSSGASAAAGAAVAAALAADAGFETHPDVVLDAALAGEAVACGARHGDNVAPALLGGFVIVTSVDPPRVARFEPALDLHVAVVTPDLELPTRDARAVLPAKIALADAARGWANAATLVLGLARGDADLVRRALVDHIVEPYRAALVPGAHAALTAARAAGALGAGISGAGPTLFALALERDTADRAAATMAATFRTHHLDSRTHVGRIDPAGTTIERPPAATGEQRAARGE